MQHELDLPQGTITVDDTGGDGPPVVFAHGLLVDGTLWRDVVAGLRGTARCVVPELPLGSHPRAMRPEADLSPLGLASIVAGVLEELDLHDATLVGNDTGGAIAQIAAAHHPERLGRLVLTNCDMYDNFLPPAFRPLQWLAHVPGAYTALLQGLRLAPVRRASFAPTTKRVDAERLRSWATPSPTDAGVRRDVVKVLKGIHPRALLDAVPKLAAWDAPKLLVWARNDPNFKLSWAERFARDVPHTRLETVADSRTFVPVDQPGRVASLVAGMLPRAQAGAAA